MTGDPVRDEIKAALDRVTAPLHELIRLKTEECVRLRLELAQARATTASASIALGDALRRMARAREMTQ